MVAADPSDTLLYSYLSQLLHMREDSNLGKIFVLLYIFINHVSVYSISTYRNISKLNTYVFHVTEFISGDYSKTLIKAFNAKFH